MRPVVLQTMWRTGGTYLAFHLRERNRVALFYEPLHEEYSLFPREHWDRFAEAAAGGPLGHPQKAFHYLTDYPFLDDAGVAGHRLEFAYDRFALGADDEAPALRAYLDGLVTHAELLGRRPLFKFCRAFLRQPWLARALDPVTVYLTRSPAGIAGSYARISGGIYFYGGFLRVVAKNRAHPYFAGLYESLAAAHPDYASADEALVAGNGIAATVPADVSLDVFLYFWALALAEHADARVLTLDANAMAAERRAAAEALGRHTGLDVDLADAVPLDPGSGELMRFGRPEVFQPLLRDALGGRSLDLSGVPDPVARQFEVLYAGNG